MRDVIGSTVKYDRNNLTEENYHKETIKALREAYIHLETKLDEHKESVRTLILAEDRLTKEELVAALNALFPA